MCKVKGSAALVIAAAAMMMFLTGCETTKHAEVMSAEELATLAQASKSEGSDVGSGEQGGIPLAGQGMSEGSLSVGGGSGSSTSGSADMSISSLNPEGPPLPTLRGGDSGIDHSGAGTLTDSSGGGTGSTSSEANVVGGDSSTPPRSPERADWMTDYPSGNRSPAALFGPESPPQATLRDGADSFAGGSSGGPGGTGGSTIESEGAGEAGPHGFEGQQFVRALTPSDFVPEAPPQANLGNDGGSTFSGSGTSETSGSGDEEVQLPHHSGTEETMEPLSQADLGSNQGDDGDGLRHVYFDFDKYVIRHESISALEWNAHLLTAKYPQSGVLIEGHCDERGTSEYNLVLGERRAKAVKNYLVDLGVLSWRIQIVSYGKERPSCHESEESCWQKNRRGHLLLQ